MTIKRKQKHTAWYGWQCAISSGSEKCVRCGSHDNLTVDHIVPKSIMVNLLLGIKTENEIQFDDDGNFQFLCERCNKIKSDWLELKNPRTYEILENAIRKAKKHHLKI